MKKSALQSKELLGNFIARNLFDYSSITLGRYGIHQVSEISKVNSNSALRGRNNESSAEIFMRK